jgi:anti-sigma factor RsiW
MNCKQALRLLSACSDGELAGPAAGVVKAHLLTCPACRRMLDSWQQDKALLQGTSRPDVSPFLATRVMAELRTTPARRSFALGPALGTVAAAVVVAVCIGVGALVGSGLARAGTSATQSVLSVNGSDPVLALQQTYGGGGQ